MEFPEMEWLLPLLNPKELPKLLLLGLCRRDEGELLPEVLLLLLPKLPLRLSSQVDSVPNEEDLEMFAARLFMVLIALALSFAALENLEAN